VLDKTEEGNIGKQNWKVANKYLTQTQLPQTPENMKKIIDITDQ